MRFVLGALVLLVAAVAAAWWLAGLPGTITLTLAGLTVETSSAIALVVLAVLLLLLLVVLRLLSWILGTGGRTARWRRRRRRSSGDDAVTGSLVALAAGDAERARSETGRARRMLGDTPQTLLLAAQAARLSGDEGAASKLYENLVALPDAALLGLRGLLQQAMAREDWVASAALAGKAELAHPGAPWLREERTRLAVRGGDWRQALALAPADAPKSAFAVAAAQSTPDASEGMRLARRTWKANPDFVPAALAYARRLQEAGKVGRAMEVLRDTWSRTPQPDLAAAALANAADPNERIRRAQRLVSGRPKDPESHLLLARLSLDAGDLGAARRELDAARRGGLDQRRVWVLRADLEGRDPNGAEAAGDALRRAAEAPSDPTWRCEACGTGLPEWRPACPVCHTPGRVTWSQLRQEMLPRVD